jgi:predicted metal-dependent hydrolase
VQDYTGTEAMITLPKVIVLAAMKKQWKVSYIHSPGALVLIEHPHRELVVYGKRYSKRAALQLINRWVKLKAATYLTELIDKLNRKVKVTFKKLVVRSHESQWGSYSSSKTISLNYRIIFLPPILTRHVVLHELCHVRVMSHSEKFWNEVAKFDKSWQKNKKALNQADCYIPKWAATPGIIY